jgi:hypothetical protein
VEKSLLGWKELEYEVVRDGADNCITVSTMTVLVDVSLVFVLLAIRFFATSHFTNILLFETLPPYDDDLLTNACLSV